SYASHSPQSGPGLGARAPLYVTELPLASPSADARRAAPAHGASAAARGPPALVPLEPRAAAITLPAEPARIDWDLDAELAADQWVAHLARHEPRRCDESGEVGSWLPKCHKRRSRFEWNTELDRAGFLNGLPYVRLGRRCILVL